MREEPGRSRKWKTFLFTLLLYVSFLSLSHDIRVTLRIAASEYVILFHYNIVSNIWWLNNITFCWHIRIKDFKKIINNIRDDCYRHSTFFQKKKINIWITKYGWMFTYIYLPTHCRVNWPYFFLFFPPSLKYDRKGARIPSSSEITL